MSDITVDPRDAFERVFPPPKHVIRCGKGYACTEYNAWGAHNFIRQWEGWSAAMLHGAEPVTTAYKLNSPVIPDGWVACSERMPDNGDKSRELYLCWGTFFDGAEPDYIPAWFFSHPTNGWSEWQPIEDDCVPEQVTITHWQPMPAAPQQEVK